MLHRFSKSKTNAYLAIAQDTQYCILACSYGSVLYTNPNPNAYLGAALAAVGAADELGVVAVVLVATAIPAKTTAIPAKTTAIR